MQRPKLLQKWRQKTKAKLADSQKRKDNYVGAYSSIFGAPTRARKAVDVAQTIDLAFGNDIRLAPYAGLSSPSSGELRGT